MWEQFLIQRLNILILAVLILQNLLQYSIITFSPLTASLAYDVLSLDPVKLLFKFEYLSIFLLYDWYKLLMF